MSDIFTDAATRVLNKPLEEWKNAGKKVLGYVCSHVPEELVSAAGILPYRLRGIETESTSIGDTYFGPFICSCPKAILENAGRGKFSFLDGAVMVQACDSMRRLDECWRKAGEDYEGILPEFFYYFGVPHKVTDYSIKWFAEEIEKFGKAIEEFFKVEITKEKILEAIKVHNETRDLLAKLEEMRESIDTPLSGAEAMVIILAQTNMPKDVFNRALKEKLSELEKTKGIHQGKKRILLAGSVVDDLALIEAIENEGAVVVSDTVCFGARSYMARITPDDDSIWVTLAKRYLHEQFCPRMFGYANERYALIKEKIEKSGADAVIFQNIRFCDLHGSENGLFEPWLEKDGVKSIRVEREYGALADEGRIRMRVAAFLETVEKGQAGKSAA